MRSTVATYANVHDELRKLFAKTQDAKDHGYKAGDFSYNTGKLRCPTCDGTGVISLDVQFLPDVEVPCPDCGGSRYSREAAAVKLPTANGEPASMADLMDMDVSTALEACADCKLVRQRLQVLKELGPWLPDPWRGDTQPFRRRSPAAEACQRDGQGAGRQCVRVR